MHITACYIAKNEAENLPRSFVSLAGAADELIVVDTGSDDGTPEVAERLGAKVYHLPWQDDFSAPRNYAIEHAKSGWLIFLDADECFTEDTAHQIRTVIRKAGKADVICMVREDLDAAGQVQKTIYVPRIFRRRKGLRYVGSIHEELRDHGAPVACVYWAQPSELRLRHTGYAGPLADEKARRNLRLLLKEQAATKHPERLEPYLAETYYGLGDRAQALAYAQRAVARGRQSATCASRAHRILLACFADGKHPEERLAAARQVVRDFPELPEFHAELAEALAAVGDFAAAVQEAGEAIGRAQHYMGIEPSELSPGAVQQIEQRRALWQARCAPQESIEELVAAVTDDTRRLVRLLMALERTDGAADARAKARALLPEAAEAAWRAYEAGAPIPMEGFRALWPIVWEHGSDAQAARFATLAGEPAAKKSCVADLLHDERWQAAFDILATVPADAADGAFWRDTGLCLFHLGAWDEAQESFSRARALGEETPAMRALTAWMAEDAEGSKA